MAITIKELEALKPRDKPYWERDTKPRGHGGLAFKVLPSGEIDSYFVYYADRRTERFKKIGRYSKTGKGGLSLKQINEAYEELSKIYRDQGDVKEVERKQQEAEQQAKREQALEEERRAMQGSLQQLIDFYLEEIGMTKSAHYSTAAKKELTRLTIDTSIKASDVTEDDIIRILHPIVERGALVLANRTRSYLSAMFAYGKAFDKGTATIAKSVKFYIKSNPVADVQRALKAEPPRDRTLSAEEVFQLWRDLDNHGMASTRKSLLRLMLATGARVEALSTLKWSQINWEQRYLTVLPANSKKGNFWVIPLNDVAMEVVKNIPRLHDELVFPADSGNGVMRTDSISNALNRFCQQIGMEPFQPRDLRTTFKTLTGEIGISKEIRDRIQNHEK